LLCIVEAQWGYHSLKIHDMAVKLLGILEGRELEVFWNGVKE
jgi:hypothetical protein